MKSVYKVGVWLFEINSLNVLPNDIHRTKSNFIHRDASVQLLV